MSVASFQCGTRFTPCNTAVGQSHVRHMRVRGLIQGIPNLGKVGNTSKMNKKRRGLEVGCRGFLRQRAASTAAVAKVQTYRMSRDAQERQGRSRAGQLGRFKKGSAYRQCGAFS